MDPPSPPKVAGKSSSQETFKKFFGGGGGGLVRPLVGQSQIFITVGPWLMKLYTTPPSILTLVAWVQRTQARPTPHVGWPSAKPDPTVCNLACCRQLQSALRVDQESFSIDSDLARPD